MDLEEIKRRLEPQPFNAAGVRGFGITMPSLEESAWLIAEVERLTALCDGYRGERDAAKDWKDSVLNAVKGTPEYNGMPWGGDKEGWGFCFELIRYLSHAKGQAESALTRARAEGMEELSRIADRVAILTSPMETDAVLERATAIVNDIAAVVRAAKGEQ